MANAKKLRIMLISGCATLLFAGGALADNPVVNANLGYVSVENHLPGSKAVNPIRQQALRETATELGARGALAWRSKQINSSLQNEADYLDQIFNFNQLLLNHSVLPPILEQSDNNISLDGNDAIRINAKTYKIFAPARFVTAAPTWRTFLWMNYKRPTLPNTTLLPRNKAEATIWDFYLKLGWKEGLTQANAIFETNLNRLKRAYMGMVLYRKLLAQHMVSSPYVAEANLGITGNAKELKIGDRILRITRHSALQTNSRKWMPVLTQ